MEDNLEFRQLINLPCRLIVALGEVTARYGQIEHLLTMTIHRTAKLSYEEAFEYLELVKYNDKKVGEFKECFEQWAISKFGGTEGARRSAQFTDLIKAWIDKDKGLADRRHDVVHCCWSIKGEQVTNTERANCTK